MLVFSTVACAACMVLSWLTIIWGSGQFLYSWFRWMGPFAHLRQFVQMTALGGLGSLMVRACFSEKRVFLRVPAVLATAGFIGWLAIFLTVQYEHYVSLSNVDREVIPGWVAWFVLQTLLLAGVLLFVRPFGYRLVASGEAVHTVTPGLWAGFWRMLARAIVVSTVIGLVVGLSFFALVVLPQYWANRQLLDATQHVGPVYNISHMNRTIFVVGEPLDDVTVDALRHHPIVTHLRVQELKEGDGTLERLPKLQYLKTIRMRAPEMSDEAVKDLERAMPNTAITVWRPTP